MLVEHLPSKREALSSNFNTHQKKKKSIKSLENYFFGKES
jgi:hypothetical protein